MNLYEYAPNEIPPYSFCEPVWASGLGLWCLRKTTNIGLKLGGGVDTPSLCGRVAVSKGWDLNVRLSEHHLEKNTCKKCLEAYREATRP